MLLRNSYVQVSIWKLLVKGVRLHWPAGELGKILRDRDHPFIILGSRQTCSPIEIPAVLGDSFGT